MAEVEISDGKRSAHIDSALLGLGKKRERLLSVIKAELTRAGGDPNGPLVQVVRPQEFIEMMDKGDAFITGRGPLGLPLRVQFAPGQPLMKPADYLRQA